jgi:hypothetical protein
VLFAPWCFAAALLALGAASQPGPPTANPQKHLQAYGLAFEPLAWHPAAKCVLVCPLVAISTWLVAAALRCVPGVKRVL